MLFKLTQTLFVVVIPEAIIGRVNPDSKNPKM